MPDSASHRWSYYAARMRSAIALSKHEHMEFSGYIVTRSSGSQAGGLLQRPITLAGSGAKAIKYYVGAAAPCPGLLRSLTKAPAARAELWPGVQ